jgi:serine/threonine-protein kinase
MSPQQTIAHYRITAKLGEGGMGEVWRATYTKLGREVAVKILPATFADDTDRLARFQRQAQVLASLNHPNIAAIYGVEDRGLVMELVDGSTLAELIAQGPLPLDEALSIAKQIGDALEAAHEKGIVHRDLKPGNIKVTPQVVVKVLDFGLAAIVQSSVTSEGNATQSPTLTLAATQMGTLLGTAAYMSPEQTRGKSVDKRADIWAFGVVLWELVTGEQLFQGETITDVLAAVVRSRSGSAYPRKSAGCCASAWRKIRREAAARYRRRRGVAGGAAGARPRTERAGFEAGIRNRRVGSLRAYWPWV